MLFWSKCYYCGAKLLMTGKKTSNEFACSKCIPKNSATRNSIDESYEYEILRFKSKIKRRGIIK